MTFANDWAVTSNPADHSKFKDQPSFVRKLRTDLEERLAAIIYGFTSGENTAPGFKQLPLLNQGSDPSAPTDAYILYAKDASAVSELHGRHEVAGVKQLTLDGLLNLSNTKIASEVRGDQFVRGASGWVRSAIGAAQRLWRSDGTDPGWAQILGLTNLDKLAGAILQSNGGFDHTLAVTNPTAARTFTLPDASIDLTGYLQVVIGSYVGNGSDNRDITVGFADTSKTPKFVLLLCRDSGGGHWMFTGDASGQAPSDGSAQTGGLKSFSANTFRVGTNAEANQNGRTINFIAVG